MDDVEQKPTGTPMEKVHDEALKRFEKAEEAEKHNRELADEDFRFVAGEQWPEQVRRQRERAQRPCLTINRLPAFIAQVVGDARQNKPAIKVHPVDDNPDPKIAELYEGLIRHIETNSSAPIAYLGALEHSCSGGFGHWRIITEYCDPNTFDQEIKIQRITNPFSVHWDDNSKEYDKSDADWCFVSEMITKEAFKARYPNHAPDDWENVFESRDYKGWTNSKNKVRIAEYWRRVRVKKTIYLLDDGAIVDQLPEGITAVRSRETFEYKVERYIMSGKEVLEGPHAWAGKYIPIVTITGPEEYVEGRIQYRSIIRYAKDPARMYNYWQTAITEKIALAPKSPWLVTTKQVEGLERFWAAANVENRAYLPYNADPESKTPPQRNSPAAVNSSEIQQSMQSIDDIKATTGLHDASLGNQGNETSGRAILARQREGDTATFAWIDNLSRGIARTGRILIDLIPKIYDAQRAIRILGEDGTSDLVEINQPQVDPMGTIVGYLNDVTVGKYDITVSAGPSFATKRIESAESMMAFMQAYPAAGPIMGDLVAKAMDWPGADDIAERLKAMLPPNLAMLDASPEEQEQMRQQSEAQQQEQERVRQMEDAAFEADMTDKATKAAKTEADIQKSQAEAEGKEIENATKAFELAMASGQLQELVRQQVAQVLQSM